MEFSRRHQAIMLALRRDGAVRAAALAADLAVSAVTIRRDLADLERRGQVARVHGGAVLPSTFGTAEPHVPPKIVGRRPTIGMVIPGTTQYFREIVEGARRAAQARDVNLVLAVSDYNLEADRLTVARLLDARVDGLLLTPSEPFSRLAPDDITWLADLPAPALFVERYHCPDTVPRPIEFVASDHRHGALQAMHHLADLGHRRISLLTLESPTSAWITAGYDAALAARGLADGMPRYENRTREALLADLGTIMDTLADAGVTAVLAHPDDIAIHVVQRARGRGLVVPDDLSVVAYNDEIASLADIPLTAVAPAREDVGRLAVEFLLRKLHDGRRDRGGLHLHVLPRIMVRASTGAPRRQPDSIE